MIAEESVPPTVLQAQLELGQPEDLIVSTVTLDGYVGAGVVVRLESRPLRLLMTTPMLDPPALLKIILTSTQFRTHHAMAYGSH